MNRKAIIFVFLFLIYSFAAGGLFAQEAAPKEMTATVFGAKIFYLEAGDAAKPTVILLHGLGSSVVSWQFNINALSENYRVIALDQIGFGKSDKPALKYRVGTYVDFLDKFMAELKIERAALVGNSLGGWVAAWMAIKYPNRVGKIVLVDAAGLKFDEADLAQIYSINYSTRDEARELIKHVFYNQIIFGSSIFVEESLRQRVLAGDGNAINSLIESFKRGEDFLDGCLAEIKKPTLIVWGRQDGILKASYGERFKREIVDSKIIFFDKCGHVPQVEKAAEFNQAVIKFLSEN